MEQHINVLIGEYGKSLEMLLRVRKYLSEVVFSIQVQLAIYIFSLYTLYLLYTMESFGSISSFSYFGLSGIVTGTFLMYLYRFIRDYKKAKALEAKHEHAIRRLEWEIRECAKRMNQS